MNKSSLFDLALNHLSQQQRSRVSRTVLYAPLNRMEQNVKHQSEQAEAAGFVIDNVIDEEGLSVSQVPLVDRAGGRRLLDLLRDGDILVCRWISSLGCNYDEIQKNIRLFLNRGVTIKTVIKGMTFDAKPLGTKDRAVQDATLSFISAMAEAQAIANKEAQAAGIAHARETTPTKYRGRKPSYTNEQLTKIEQLLQKDVGNNEIARQVGLSKFAVSRILKDVESAYAKLSRWEKVELR